MKKLMIMAAFMVAAVTANAQGEVGTLTIQPKVGLNLTTITNSEKVVRGFDYSSKMHVGFAAGIEAEYVVANNVSVALGALYSKQGVGIKDFKFSSFTQEKNRVSLDYIDIPIVANYYIIPGLAIKAGIQPSFLVGAKWKTKVAGESHSFDAKDSFKKFDLAIPLGASYEYKNVVLDVRYNLGVLKINKDKIKLADVMVETDASCRNSVIQFTLGYKLPVK
jgi:hypothetical protein